MELVAERLKDLAIERGREDAEAKVETFQRERRLRVQTKSKVVGVGLESEVGLEGEKEKRLVAPGLEFKDIAAEYFILPLINRFWNHYQDESTRSVRARSTSTSSSMSSAGTGMILSPLSLTKLLATLMVLLHASRHSNLFLAVLAPEALQLAVTLGSRPISRSLSSFSEGNGEGEEEEEVSVLGSALDLAVVVLDATRELDGGRTLMYDHTGLVLAAAEWAEIVFRRTEKGERVLGEGGEMEGRVRRSSAGLCVQIGEIREKWVRLTGYE